MKTTVTFAGIAALALVGCDGTAPRSSAAVTTPSGVKLIPPDKRKAAPDLTLKDPEGKPVSLSGLHGKPVMITFWAVG